MDLETLYQRIKDMPEAERLRLDPICKALDNYTAKQPSIGGRAAPNRVIALACIDLTEMWSQQEMERE